MVIAWPGFELQCLGYPPCAARTGPCHSLGLRGAAGGVALSASLSIRCHESSSPFSFFTVDAELTYFFFFFSFHSALFKNCDLMWKQSMWTSTISSHLATKHLKEGGLLTLAGAKAALEGTPGKPSARGPGSGRARRLLSGLRGASVGRGVSKPSAPRGALCGWILLPLGLKCFRRRTREPFMCVVLGEQLGSWKLRGQGRSCILAVWS